jgi:2',3'-cyclic-nucleotide 2'-phosphodiesterase/3'-nucleotidase
MNAMRYDAVVVGNHEFNYGVPYLDSARAAARFPIIAANVRSKGATPKYASFVLVKRAGVTVGVVGATTPGSNLWDASNLSRAGLHVVDILPSVRSAVGEARAAGADAIVVVLHSGLDEPSSYDTVSTAVASENVAARVASEIPGVNVLVYGHSHRENRGQMLAGTLLIQPKNWATSVAVVTLPLSCGANHHWIAAAATGSLIQSANHAENAAVIRAASRAHAATVAYVSSRIGTTPDSWTAADARGGPTPIMNFILDVEKRAAHVDIASASAFDLDAHLGPGPITVAQIAQLYPYDNTLRAVRISGAQLREYLEFSSRYYKSDAGGQPVIDTTVAGYNFDMVSGVDYELDLTRPVGQRVTSLKFRGRPVAPTDSFTLALNNYRQTGGGGYAMLRGAPVVYDRQQEIRQLLIDEVRRRRVLHKSDFDARNWSMLEFTAKAATQPRTRPK